MRKLNYLMALMAMFVLCGCPDSVEDVYLNLGTETITFPYSGGEQKVAVSSNSNWSISGLPDWISASVVSGIGNSEITLRAEANSGRDDRSGVLTICTNESNQSRAITIHQEGTHSAPIHVNDVSERVFGGKVTNVIEDSIIVNSDVRWTIEGPSWLTATYKNKALTLSGTILEGSGTVYLKVNSAYSGGEVRKETIKIKTVSTDEEITIPVQQLGKDDIVCDKTLVLSDGFVSQFKFGSNVTRFAYGFYTGTPLSNQLTYSVIKEKWGHTEANANVCVAQTSLEPNSDYTLCVIGINGNNYYAALDKIIQHKIHTPSDQNQPRAYINNVVYKDGIWNFDIQVNEYAIGYYLTYEYKNTYSSSNISLQKLWIAHDILYYGVGLYDNEPSSWGIKEQTDVYICTWAMGINGRSHIVDIYDTATGGTKTPVSRAPEVPFWFSDNILHKEKTNKLNIKRK